MDESQIEIPLDDIVLSLESEAETRRLRMVVKAEITFPTGDTISTGFTYDFGTRWIPDPLVHKTREYMQPDEETFMRLASRDYVKIVSDKITELLENGKMRLRYDGQVGTLKDFRKYLLQKEIESIDKQ